MRIDYRKLERDIPEIAAQVERVSGLKVPLHDLEFVVTDVVINDSEDFKSVASYSPSLKRINIHQNTIPSASSQNLVNMYVGHELMHHAQYSIKTFRKNVENHSLHRSWSRLIEGDATWVEDKLKQFYPLNFVSTIFYFVSFELRVEYAGVTREIFGNLPDSYGLGKRKIDALVASGGRAAVNRLYQADPKEISYTFSDSAMEDSVTPGEINFLKAIDILQERISDLSDKYELAQQKYQKRSTAIQNKIASLRLKNWLETESKNYPEVADLKRIYDEAMTICKKK